MRFINLHIDIVFAWYDLWIGAYWDRKDRKLYILPVPCLGVCLYLTKAEK